MKKFVFLVLLLIVSFYKTNSYAQAGDPFIGQIALVPYNFEPRGWAFCDGRLLRITENTALFALLGTTYGGNGQTTFALPDLRGRVAISFGTGPGLTARNLGEMSGEENHTLTIAEMPKHNHTVAASSTEGNQNSPSGNFPADTKLLDKEYSNTSNGAIMNTQMINQSGSSLPHNNMQPYTTLNYIIALQGVFPSRN